LTIRFSQHIAFSNAGNPLAVHFARRIAPPHEQTAPNAQKRGSILITPGIAFAP